MEAQSLNSSLLQPMPLHVDVPPVTSETSPPVPKPRTSSKQRNNELSRSASLYSLFAVSNTEDSPIELLYNRAKVNDGSYPSLPMNVVEKAFNKAPLANVVEEYSFFRRILESIRCIFCSDNTNKQRAVEYKLGVQKLNFIKAIEKRSKDAVAFLKNNDEIHNILNLQFLAKVFVNNGSKLSLAKRDDGDFLLKLSVPVIDGDGKCDELGKSICIKQELVSLCEHGYNHSTGQVYSSSVYIENGFFDYYYSVMASKSPQINNNEGRRLEEQHGAVKALQLDNELLLNKIELLEDLLESERGKIKDKESDFTKLNIQNEKLISKEKDMKLKLKKNEEDILSLGDKIDKASAQAVHTRSDLENERMVNIKLNRELEQINKDHSNLKLSYDASRWQVKVDAETIQNLSIEVEALKLQLGAKKSNVVTRAFKKIG